MLIKMLFIVRNACADASLSQAWDDRTV